MTVTKVILLACGSFNPPTNMHLRLFELARDYLNRLGNYVVIGGLVSPVHDAYGKKELISSTHRLAMLKHALETSEWIKVSDWECKQENWSRTKHVIQYHQNLVNSVITNSYNEDLDSDLLNWLSNSCLTKGCNVTNVKIKLLCGSDLLESFGTPGLWSDEDIENIVGCHGIMVVTREGSNPLKFIYESDLLTKYMNNIHIVTEWITNEISSTKIRRAVRRQESVKYLIPDNVINYIYMNNLYGAQIRGTQNRETKYIELIESPDFDVTMESPSPSGNNCINICNNNLMSIVTNNQQNTDEQKTNLIVAKDQQPFINEQQFLKKKLKKKNSNSNKHPGQAVKISNKDMKNACLV